MVGMLNAPKGTKLFERMKQEGRLLHDFNGSNTDINFIPKMDASDLLNGYHRVVQAIYSPQNYYQRVKVFLETFRPEPHRKRRSSASDVGALFKACFLLGIVSSGRKEYWKLLFWSLAQKRGAFSMAVIFSVYGYHFRKYLSSPT